MYSLASVRLFFCEQHNSKTHLWIFFKFSHIVHIYWLNWFGLTGLLFKLFTKIWQKFSPWISIASHHHSCSQETLAPLFSLWDVDVTIAYFKATLTFIGPLLGQRSVLYKCNSLVFFIFLSYFGDLDFQVLKENEVHYIWFEKSLHMIILHWKYRPHYEKSVKKIRIF